MTVGAAMSGVLTKIHVIPHGITVKTRFVTKPHYPSQFETVTYHSQLKKSKNQKRQKKKKNLIKSVDLHFRLASRFSHSLSLGLQVALPDTD